MRVFFVAVLALMLVWTVVMGRLGGESVDPGRTPLVWTSDDNPLRKEQVALFNRLHPDLNLTLDPANQGMEKVIVQSIGGVGPDLFDCRDANQLSAYVKAGIALDVTDELRGMGIDVLGETWPAMRSVAVHEGRVYGVPTNIGANALWVNQDLLPRGVVLPSGAWTWSEFIALAQRVTRRDQSGRVVQAGLLFDWYNWPHFLYGFGGRVFSSDGTRCVIDSAEAVQAVSLMQDLVYRYKVTPSPVEEAGMAGQGGWGAGNINLFGAKRGVFALGGRWWLANLRKFDGLRLGVVESPHGTRREFGAVGRATLVNANGPRRTEALRFLSYLASPEYNGLVNDQADGICAFARYAQGDAFEHNPSYPAEDFNLVWRSVSARAVAPESSPYVNGQLANRLIERQLDLVRIGQKMARDALRDAARDINREIARSLDEDPALRERWEAARGPNR
ncbi:MAG: extracellular solute-binding protein [Fimbriimonadaceae bacterium]|nr:extracellular solute-binding protein [Fimbriimonadaceae bacterium]